MKAHASVSSICAAALLAAAGHAQAQLAFSHSPLVSTLNYPSAVTHGDFNADGKQDIAFVQFGDNSVAVTLGNGDGTFQNPSRYVVGAQPIAIATGDFNGDGIADLAVLNSNDKTVTILLGTGSGTGPTGFIAFPTLATQTAPAAIAVGDVNGDGKPDIAVSNGGSNTVSVYLGLSSGMFASPQVYPVGASPRGLVLADLNNDGKLDLAVADTSDNNIAVLLNTGSGAFGVAAYFPTLASPMAVTTGDFDKDGKIDIASANYGSIAANPGSVSVLFGLGSGSFAAHVDYPARSGAQGIVAADFNHDNVLDLAVVNYFDDSVSLLRGNSNGTFHTQTLVATGQQPYAIDSVDLDKDGRLDLVVPNRLDNTVSILLNDLIFADDFELH